MQMGLSLKGFGLENKIGGLPISCPTQPDEPVQMIEKNFETLSKNFSKSKESKALNSEPERVRTN